MELVSGVLPRVRREYDREVASELAAIDTGSATKVQQQFAKDADINEIVRRFGLTGELPPPRAAHQYGDFSEVKDFQGAMEQLAIAREAFDLMPAEIREEFGYDPAYFVDWVSDPANEEAARSAGLLPAKKSAEASGVPAAAPPEAVQPPA